MVFHWWCLFFSSLVFTGSVPLWRRPRPCGPPVRKNHSAFTHNQTILVIIILLFFFFLFFPLLFSTFIFLPCCVFYSPVPFASITLITLMHRITKETSWTMWEAIHVTRKLQCMFSMSSHTFTLLTSYQSTKFSRLVNVFIALMSLFIFVYLTRNLPSHPMTMPNLRSNPTEKEITTMIHHQISNQLIVLITIEDPNDWTHWWFSVN